MGQDNQERKQSVVYLYDIELYEGTTYVNQL